MLSAVSNAPVLAKKHPDADHDRQRTSRHKTLCLQYISFSEIFRFPAAEPNNFALTMETKVENFAGLLDDLGYPGPNITAPGFDELDPNAK